MLLWIDGKAFSPDQTDLIDRLAEEKEYLKPVLKFIWFWFSESPAFSTQTSGSTSEPKSIEISRDQIKSSAISTLQFFGLNPKTDGLVLCLSASHVGGFMILARALLGDLDVCILEPSAKPISEEGLPPFKNWFISMVPLQFYNLLENIELKRISKSWKGILLGGAALENSIAEKLGLLACPLYHGYGMTETVSHIAVREIPSTPSVLLSEIPFTALPGVALWLNEQGCLEIKAPVTGEKWIITNDKVTLITSNQFLFTGRADQQINSGGKKIVPEDVRGLVHSLLPANHPDFEILGIPDPYWGEKVVLVFFVADPDEFQKFMKVLDPEGKFQGITNPEKRFLLPKSIFNLPEKPLTQSQKTDFPRIRKELETAVAAWEKPETGKK
jgi:O-succinylbenzoic acid--CoA ligase